MIDAQAITADLPPDHPLHERAQALRRRLAQVHFDRAAALAQNPGARVLHFGLARILSGQQAPGHEAAVEEIRARTGAEQVQFRLTEEDGRVKLKAKPYGAGGAGR